jgi:cytochrome b6-f complex iron-sulfur subunit
MDIDNPVTRRTLLAAGAGTAGVIALAACSSSSSDSSSDSSSGSSAGGGKSQAPSGDSSGSGSSGGTTLATLSSIKVGEAISVKLPNGKPGIVARPTADTAVAFSAICTHQGCTVKPAGNKLDCPCHGSVYNALTGAVINPPAPAPLPKVDVVVKDGKVVTA